MATIFYLPGNEENQVVTEITKIARLGIEGNGDARELAKYIRQGLEQLSKMGVPPNKRLMMESEEENGDKRTFQLLKDIKHIPYPLYEFRVNRTTPGAFRAIFFEFEYGGEQFLVFTKAVLKKGNPNPPEFQQAIRESLVLYEKLHENPKLFFGEDD